MRRELIVGAVVLSLVASSQAWAQSVIELAPEQRLKIKEYVVHERVKPIVIKAPLSIGAEVPSDVELVTVPQVWGPSFESLRYVYVGNRVVLVEPTTRQVVQIID